MKTVFNFHCENFKPIAVDMEPVETYLQVFIDYTCFEKREVLTMDFCFINRAGNPLVCKEMGLCASYSPFAVNRTWSKSNLGKVEEYNRFYNDVMFNSFENRKFLGELLELYKYYDRNERRELCEHQMHEKYDEYGNTKLRMYYWISRYPRNLEFGMDYVLRSHHSVLPPEKQLYYRKPYHKDSSSLRGKLPPEDYKEEPNHIEEVCARDLTPEEHPSGLQNKKCKQCGHLAFNEVYVQIPTEVSLYIQGLLAKYLDIRKALKVKDILSRIYDEDFLFEHYTPNMYPREYLIELVEYGETEGEEYYYEEVPQEFKDREVERVMPVHQKKAVLYLAQCTVIQLVENLKKKAHTDVVSVSIIEEVTNANGTVRVVRFEGNGDKVPKNMRNLKAYVEENGRGVVLVPIILIDKVDESEDL